MKPGPPRVEELYREIARVEKTLTDLGFIASHQHIAAVISCARGVAISRDAVRARRRRANQERNQ